jgi:hypothetical protein
MTAVISATGAETKAQSAQAAESTTRMARQM